MPDQPLHKSRDRIGRAFFNRLGAEIAFAVGCRHGQRYHRWLAFDGGTPAREGQVILLHQRREGGIYKIKDGLDRTAAVLQRLLPDSGRGENGFHILVPVHIGAAEAIDGLLRIADKKKLASPRNRFPPVALGRIASGEQKQHLGLHRVRVMKFIDEDPAEPVLKISARIVILQQLACAEQQVVKVELPRFLLGLLVETHQFPQLVAQGGGEIGIRRPLKSLDPKRETAPAVEQIVALHLLAQEARAFF